MMKISVLAILLAIISIFVLEARHARLMMFVDINEYESGTPQAIPISMDCASALYEQAGPVLMSSSIFKVLITRRLQAFQEFEQYPSYKTYYELYKKINNDIQQIFSEMLNKNKTDITSKMGQILDEKLENDKNFQEQKERARNTNSLDNDLSIALMQFIPHDWDIYTLNNEWFLLIPHEYQRYMQELYTLENSLNTESASNKIFYDKKTKRALTDNEIAIGLKTGNFKKLLQLPDQVDFLSPEQKEIMKTKIYMQELCSFLFVNYNDISSKDTADSILPQHTIYIDGHGRYSKVTGMFDIRLQESAQLQQDIGFFQKGNIENFPPDKQEKIKKLLDLEKEIDQMITASEGTIAGLSLPGYTQFLDFLNTKISTTILYYSTCFGGGRHLYFPFVSRGLDKTYNYPIISSVLDDVPSVFNRVHFTILYPPRKVEIIYKNGTADPRLRYESTIYFAKFFNAVEHNMPFGTLLHYVTDPNVPRNIPAVRLPGTSWFNATRLGTFAYLTNATISAARTKKIIDVSGKKAVLLYTPIIPLNIKITIKEKKIKPESNMWIATKAQAEEQIPVFTSVMPDNQQTHWIQSLEAPDCLLTAVINNFFDPDLLRKRIILIDTLITRNNFSEKNSKMLGIKENEKIVLTKVGFFNGIQSPVLDSSNWERGMLFTYQNKAYKIVYAAKESVLWNKNDTIKTLSNPIDIVQEITNLTEEDAKDYKDWYQRWKEYAENKANRIIEVDKLEDFIRTHAQKVAEKKEKRQARKKAIKESDYFKKLGAQEKE